jgi:hypothetical protein
MRSSQEDKLRQDFDLFHQNKDKYARLKGIAGGWLILSLMAKDVWRRALEYCAQPSDSLIQSQP